jgi:hypothetical protein
MTNESSLTGAAVGTHGCLNNKSISTKKRQSQTKMNSKFLVLGATAALCLTTTIARADLVFDNMTVYQSGGDTNAHVASTGSVPNTFMGDAYTLATGTTSITGFDIYPVNLSGTSYNALKMSIYVWGSVNMGTVGAATPAFGNLLGSYTLTGTGTFTTGYYFPYEGSPIGVNPGITLGTPISLSSPTIGITFNFQGSTDGGVTYNSANSLTSLISYGVAPTVGTEVFNGYYRNAASEVDGNFVSSLRSLGYTYQSLGLRVYGVIPEPSSLALAGLGAVALMAFRRRH